MYYFERFLWLSVTRENIQLLFSCSHLDILSDPDAQTSIMRNLANVRAFSDDFGNDFIFNDFMEKYTGVGVGWYNWGRNWQRRKNWSKIIKKDKFTPSKRFLWWKYPNIWYPCVFDHTDYCCQKHFSGKLFCTSKKQERLSIQKLPFPSTSGTRN